MAGYIGILAVELTHTDPVADLLDGVNDHRSSELLLNPIGPKRKRRGDGPRRRGNGASGQRVGSGRGGSDANDAVRVDHSEPRGSLGSARKSERDEPGLNWHPGDLFEVVYDVDDLPNNPGFGLDQLVWVTPFTVIECRGDDDPVPSLCERHQLTANCIALLPHPVEGDDGDTRNVWSGWYEDPECRSLPVGWYGNLSRGCGLQHRPNFLDFEPEVGIPDGHCVGGRGREPHGRNECERNRRDRGKDWSEY